MYYAGHARMLNQQSGRCPRVVEDAVYRERTWPRCGVLLSEKKLSIVSINLAKEGGMELDTR